MKRRGKNATQTLLIGDIGGTNARFALANTDAPGFAKELTLQCGEFPSADDAIRRYLSEVSSKDPDAICLAAAGPVVDRRVRFTNNHWVLSADDLAASFGIERVRLLNDFESIAYSMPHISADDLLPVGQPAPRPLGADDFSIGIVGPGTGLGAVGLKKTGETILPIPGEASHGGFSPESAVQIEVLKVLRERFDRVSTERLVSGPGLENIYWALSQIRGEPRAYNKSPADIFAAAAAKDDAIAVDAVQLFFEVLGQFAGDFALALGAFDGIFIGGGITQRYPELVSSSPFRAGFESKGRYRARMERIPTQLIMYKQPGLLGAAYVALTLIAS